MRQGRRLVTKLWSAARLCEPQIQAWHAAAPGNLQQGAAPGNLQQDAAPGNLQQDAAPGNLQSAICNLQSPTDRWLLSALQAAIAEATACWEAYDSAGALAVAERFFWATFCDQYLELVKGRLYDGAGAARASAQATLAHAFEAILKLLAPVLPHIAEELYGRLYPGRGSIHTAAWPAPAPHDPEAERVGAALLALVAAVRRHKTARGRSLGAPLAALQIACADAALRVDLQAAADDIAAVARAAALRWADTGGAGREQVAPGLWLLIAETPDTVRVDP
jgi:valyl-tRNA synthetase